MSIVQILLNSIFPMHTNIYANFIVNNNLLHLKIYNAIILYFQIERGQPHCSRCLELSPRNHVERIGWFRVGFALG